MFVILKQDGLNAVASMGPMTGTRTFTSTAHQPQLGKAPWYTGLICNTLPYFGPIADRERPAVYPSHAANPKPVNS